MRRKEEAKEKNKNENLAVKFLKIKLYENFLNLIVVRYEKSGTIVHSRKV